MIIDYSKNINKFDASEAALRLVTIFGNQCHDKPWLIKEVEGFISEVKPLLDHKDQVAKLKEKLNTQRSFIALGDINSMFPVFKRIYERIEISLSSRLMLLNTLCRIWEWPYWSDDELNALNQNMEQDIEGLNLFNMDCAYKGELKGDIFEDIDAQWDNIQSYLVTEGLPLLDKNKVLQTIQLALDVITGRVTLNNISCSVNNAIDQWRTIRKRSNQFSQDMRLQLNLGRSVNSLMSKTSGSIYNSIAPLKDAFGCNISNVIGNFLLPQNCLLPKSYCINTLSIPFEANYYKLAYGKGDGFKLRVVGEPATIYQNYLKSGADELKTVMKRNPNIATYDQESRFNSMINDCTDAFGVDFTGYSDYLSRNLLFFLMEEVYLWDPDITGYYRTLLSMPARIGNVLKTIPFGSLQGSMLDFALITDANQFMWFLACLYCTLFDEAVFVGDDRAETYDKLYPQYFMKIQCSMSVVFNCKTNWSKTESWQKDGLVSFCKITYNKRKLPCSGISANLWLKHKPYLSDLNSFFMQFKKVGYLDCIDPDEIFENLISVYQSDLELMAIKQNVDLTEKIALAKKIPFEYGGFDFNSVEEPLEYLQMVKVMIMSYYYGGVKDSKFENTWEIFSGMMTDEGTLISETDHGKHLMTNILDFEDVLMVLGTIDDIFNDFTTTNGIDMEAVREVRKSFNDIVRTNEYRLSVNNISTKNRCKINLNGDKILTNMIKASKNEITGDSSGWMPSNYMMYCLLGRMVKDDTINSPLILFRVINKNASKLNGGLIQYEGFNHESYLGYVPLEDRGKSHPRIFRIEKGGNNIYNGTQGTFYPTNMIPEGEAELVLALCMVGEHNISQMIKMNNQFLQLVQRIEQRKKEEILDNKRSKAIDAKRREVQKRMLDKTYGKLVENLLK